MSIELEPMTFGGGDESGRGPKRIGRVVIGVSAALIIALAGGLGFGIGRNADDSTDQSALAAGDEADDGTSPEDKTGSTEPAGYFPDGNAPLLTTPPVATIPPIQIPAPTISDRGADIALAAESADFVSGGSGYTAFEASPQDLLFERVTSEGVTLRAHLGQIWDNGADYGFEGWTPAPWCFESGQLRVAIGGGGIIDVGGVGWYSEPFKGRAVSWIHMGGSDGQPHWVIVAQTSPETTNVSATFEDGTADSVAPQNGIALLAVPAEARPAASYPGEYTFIEPPPFDVTFETASGPTTVGSEAIPIWDDPEFRASCSPPPPALPEAGEQPADPAAAETAVIEVMGRTYDPTQDPGSRGIYLDDDTGVAEAREQVSEGDFASEADSATATIEELVFTTPSEAWFRYRVDTNGVGLTDRYGIAVLVDDAWLITRNTVCQDLAIAGGDCGSGWQQIVPPSIAEYRIEE